MGRVSMICRVVALVCLSALASPVHAADLRREDPRDAATLRRVVDLVGKNYVEPSRVDPRRMLWAAAVALDKEIPRWSSNRAPPRSR
jgi:hypothetical protein